MIQGAAFGTTIYSLTDLGTLGGNSSTGAAINDAGKATGSSTLPGGQTRAFLWDSVGGMQNLGAAGSGDSNGRDINNNDHIVGNTDGQPFRWTTSGMVVIDPAQSGDAADLNENDQVFGYRNLGTSDRALLWSSSNTISNPYPTTNAQAVAGNDSGQYVGTLSGGSPGFYSPGGASPRQNLGSFILQDINNSALIAGGTGSDAALYDVTTSTLLTVGKLNPLDTLARFLGINNLGMGVGESVGTGAFVYTSALGLQSLNAMLTAKDAGWTVLSATDINNNGMIVGTGLSPNGETRAVILQEVPAPAGDFDGDGDRDGQDFLLWQRGQSPNPHSQEDLAVWQLCYGTTTPVSAFIVVPEPGTEALILFVALSTACRRKQ
jgi:probable HAF family extracellular repeat protein